MARSGKSSRNPQSASSSNQYLTLFQSGDLRLYRGWLQNLSQWTSANPLSRSSSLYDINADPVFIPAEIRGYRMWAFDQGAFAPRAASSFGYFWKPGVNYAQCYSNGNHNAPDKDCHVVGHGCGFYGWHTGFPDGFDNHITYPLLGVIRVSGRIILGTKGFRAEKAEIEAFAPALPHTGQWGLVQELAHRFKVRAMQSGEAAFAAYPPDDLSALFPEPEPGLDERLATMGASLLETAQLMAGLASPLSGIAECFREWIDEWQEQWPTADDGMPIHPEPCCCRKCYFRARVSSYKEWGRMVRPETMKVRYNVR